MTRSGKVGFQSGSPLLHSAFRVHGPPPRMPSPRHVRSPTQRARGVLTPRSRDGHHGGAGGAAATSMRSRPSTTGDGAGSTLCTSPSMRSNARMRAHPDCPRASQLKAQLKAQLREEVGRLKAQQQRVNTLTGMLHDCRRIEQDVSQTRAKFVAHATLTPRHEAWARALQPSRLSSHTASSPHARRRSGRSSSLSSASSGR